MRRKTLSQLSHEEFGRWAEQAAEKFLKKKKMKLICRNYRRSVGEIDLIMQDRDFVVFVEVKASRSEESNPETHVDRNKQKRLVKTAKSFLSEYKLYDVPARFDIVTIKMIDDNDIKIEYEENAFEAKL